MILPWWQVRPGQVLACYAMRKTAPLGKMTPLHICKPHRKSGLGKCCAQDCASQGCTTPLHFAQPTNVCTPPPSTQHGCLLAGDSTLRTAGPTAIYQQRAVNSCLLIPFSQCNQCYSPAVQHRHHPQHRHALTIHNTGMFNQEAIREQGTVGCWAAHHCDSAT
jgi:hypothetical protein